MKSNHIFQTALTAIIALTITMAMIGAGCKSVSEQTLSQAVRLHRQRIDDLEFAIGVYEKALVDIENHFRKFHPNLVAHDPSYLRRRKFEEKEYERLRQIIDELLTEAERELDALKKKEAIEPQPKATKKMNEGEM